MSRKSIYRALGAAFVAFVASLNAGAALASAGPAYVAGTPTLDTVTANAANAAPWTLSQGDPSASPYGSSLPTFAFGGAPSVVFSSLETPNLSIYPGSKAANGSGTLPYASGFAGTPGPLAGYCAAGGGNPEIGAVARQPIGSVLAMSPYYFPYVMRNPNDPSVLTGFFDYRPKDSQEAIVVANSFDNGNSWHYVDEKLELNSNVCPDGIQNDNGQGHPYVSEIGGLYYLYTLNRVSGDSLGQGLLVHRLNWAPSSKYPWGDPIASLPTSEPVDGGPNPANSQTAGVAPGYAAGVTAPGSTTASAAVTVPNYQEHQTGVTIAVASTANFSNLKGGPGGQLIDVGASSAYSTLNDSTLPAIHCTETTTATTFTGCVAVDAAGQTGDQSVSVNVGDTLVAPPEVPDTAMVTDPASEGSTSGSGLQAPDGIIGTVPAASLPATLPNGSARSSIPAGATVFIYGEKLLNYYMPAALASSKSIAIPTSGAGVAVPVTSFGYTGAGAQTSASLTNDTQPSSTPNPLTPAVTISLGYTSAAPSTAEGIASVTCTGADTDFGGSGKGDELTGCTAGGGLPAGTSSVTVKGESEIGGPGACTASSATLAQTGEGSTKPKTLFKNNEDYSVVRAAYTTDGLTFHDLGVVSGLNDPSYTGDAGDTTPVGQSGSDELRWVASRGTIIPTAEGETMFMSGADCQDGDSDAFQQIFYSNSKNGIEWSQPVPLITNDPTFAASAEQDAALGEGVDLPLSISAYYSGRAYDPNVIQSPSGGLTMLFSGYRTPKPLPTAGAEAAAIGSNAAFPYKPGASDPALYRNILTVDLTLKENGPEGPAGKEGKEGAPGKEGTPGKEGAQGPEGPAGEEGAPGQEGPAGKEGLTGPIGPVGPAGPAGPQGAPGPQGAVGRKGPPGSAGTVKCTLSLTKTKVTVTCHVVDTTVETTNEAARVASAGRSARVRVTVSAARRTIAHGAGVLRGEVVSAKLALKHAPGRSRRFVVKLGLPGGVTFSESVAAPSK